MLRPLLVSMTTLLALGLTATSSATPAGGADPSPGALVLNLVRNGLAPANAGVVTRLVAADYIEHDPQVAAGRAGLLKALAERGPQKYEVVRTLTDGDLVILHARAGQKTGAAAARFDVFRVAGGKVAEHWSAQQADADKRGASGRTLLDGETTVTDRPRTEQNRAFVRTFYTELFRKGNVSALSAIDPRQYDQHNPAIPDGLAAVTKFFQSFASAPAPAVPASPSPAAPLLVNGEGNFMLVRSVNSFGGQATLVYDLFRLNEGRIVEHWDVIQPLTGTPKNSNGPL